MGSFSNVGAIIADAGRILADVARSRLLWALLAMDLAFLFLHLGMTGFDVMDTAPHSVDWARIDRDGSLSETAELVLLLGAAVMLTARAVASRRAAAMPLAAILAFLAADDVLLFHESASSVLLPGHQNYGELLFFALLLLVSAGLSATGWYLANRRERAFFVAIWSGIGLLGGFGVGVDALHVQAWKWFVSAERGIGIVEDFGELVAISLIAALSWRFLRDAMPVARDKATLAATTQLRRV